MSRSNIKYIIATVVVGLGLVAPAPAMAAVNPDLASAAAAGIQYLAHNQLANGSISGLGGESEWSVEAIQADGQKASDFAYGGTSLLDFLKTDSPAPGTATTTLERKIIAIAAAGQDPASFGGVNYEALLEAQHASGQIGDPTLLNDDIFGIIAIDAAHDTSLMSEAQDSLNYLMAHQGTDGGFSYTTDSCAWCGSDNNDTAAAIIAMYAASDLGLTRAGLDTAKTQALAYLLSTQQADGGFAYDQVSPSDGSSTAWSLMALNATGDSVATSATSARNWLMQNQNADGGFSFAAYGTTTSDTYTTANAVIALLGTTWLMRPTPIAVGSQPPQLSGGSGGGTTQQSSPASSGSATAASAAPVIADSAVQTPTDTTGTPSDASNDASRVKAASIVVPRKTGKQPEHNGASHAYSVYAAAALGLAALIWFVLESRKGSRGNI